MDELMMEYEVAVKEYQVALNQFGWATHDYIDTATRKLHYAEERLNSLKREIERYKKEFPSTVRNSSFLTKVKAWLYSNE